MAAVEVGLYRYPLGAQSNTGRQLYSRIVDAKVERWTHFMTLGPRNHISPSGQVPLVDVASRPSSSMSRASVLGIRRPTEPG